MRRKLSSAMPWVYTKVTGIDVKKEAVKIGSYYREPVHVREHITDSNLKRLLRHAREQVPYYRDKLSSVSFQCFPVIKKDTIKSNYDEFFAKNYDIRKCKKVSTSGSTGVPFSCFHDKGKQEKKLGSLLYYNQLLGYEVGAPYALVRMTKKSPIIAFLQNEISFRPSSLDDVSIGFFLEKLKRKRAEYLIGHPSVFSLLSSYSDKANMPVNVKGCIATSEVLTEKDREAIKTSFNCDVLGRYATEEHGVLAHEHNKEKGYFLNTHGFFFEFLKPTSNQPAEIGEVARIVVTDLFSFAMPLIRYDLGDLVTTSYCSKSAFGVKLISIDGKEFDSIHNAEDKVVSPHAISVAVKGCSSVSSFQLQWLNQGRYRFIYTGKLSPSETSNINLSLCNLLKVGDVEFLEVDDIPPLSSGKRVLVKDLRNT